MASFSLDFSADFDTTGTTPNPTPAVVNTNTISTTRSAAKRTCNGVVCGNGPYWCSRLRYVNNAYIPAITICNKTTYKNQKLYTRLPT